MTQNHTLRLSCALVALIASASAADPRPIELIGGNWQTTANPFGASGLTLDVRRFAYIPDAVDPINGATASRPRVNFMALAPGDDRLFFIDEGPTNQTTHPGTGAIYAVTHDGVVTELFNVGGALQGSPSQLQHDFLFQGGLRSVAFHPDFADNTKAGYGKIYTTQMSVNTGTYSNYLGTSASGTAGDSVLAEWDATFDGSGNLTGIDASSYREVFRVRMPGLNHPVREAVFNPLAQPGDEDYGLLYVMHGDGNADGQNGADALGKILRIDPLDPDGAGGAAYAVPASNPFVGDGSVMDEIYAMGFRNPHNAHFVTTGSGQTLLFVANIGESAVEEIELVAAGANHGWEQWEGTFDFGPASSTTGFIFPVAQYGRGGSGGAAVSGGYAIDNGSELDGYYFFGDLVGSGGPIFAIATADALSATTQGVAITDMAPVDPLTVNIVFDHDDDPNTPSIAMAGFLDIIDEEGTYQSGFNNRTDVHFGLGPGGELYLMNKRNGWVYLVSNSVAPVPAPAALPVGLSMLILMLGRRTLR